MRVEWSVESFEHRIAALALPIALLAPPAAAAALIPARAHTDNANVALGLVVVVVAVATLGHRFATVVSAVSAAVWFDFFQTRPYYSFTISGHDDVVTAILLLLVGVAVGELAIRGRRHLQRARIGSSDLSRLYAIAELVVQGFGRTFGRFLLTPTPGLPVTFDRRIIAIALSDQVAAAFLAETAMNDL